MIHILDVSFAGKVFFLEDYTTLQYNEIIKQSNRCI